MIDDKISESLGMNPIEGELLPVEVRVDATAEDDFEQARKNILELVQQGQDAMQDLQMIAKASQHPRAYEVLNSMLNSLVSANKTVLDLHKRKADIVKAEDSAGSPKNLTQQIFVGTTAELLTLWKQNGGKKAIANESEEK
jgi:hypothetical protein